MLNVFYEPPEGLLTNKEIIFIYQKKQCVEKTSLQMPLAWLHTNENVQRAI